MSCLLVKQAVFFSRRRPRLQIAKKSQLGYNRTRLERKQVGFLHEPVAVCHIHAVLLPGAASRGHAIESFS